MGDSDSCPVSTSVTGEEAPCLLRTCPTAKRGWEFTRTLLRLRADLVLPWKCVQFRPLSLSLLKLQGEKLGEEMSLLVLARAGWLLSTLGSFFSIMLS